MPKDSLLLAQERNWLDVSDYLIGTQDVSYIFHY